MDCKFPIWHRLELPMALYRELERAAKVDHISVQGKAAQLISRGLRQEARQAETAPFASENIAGKG
jgi:hypothetical protein